jgi:hypothetical protein
MPKANHYTEQLNSEENGRFKKQMFDYTGLKAAIAPHHIAYKSASVSKTIVSVPTLPKANFNPSGISIK